MVNLFTYTFLATTVVYGTSAAILNVREIPPAGEFLEIQTSFRDAFPRTPCLTVINATNGSPVTVQDCSASTEQRGFQVIAGGASSGEGAAGPIKIFNTFCLDVTNGVDADGTKVQIWTCNDGNTNQLWQYNADGSIEWANHGKCLDVTDGNLSNGNQLQIWDCSSGNRNQEFVANTLAQPLNEVVLQGTNLCIGADNQDNGSPVFITSCSDTTARKVWTSPQIGHGNSGSYKLAFGPDGTAPFKCIDVKDGVVAPGTKLQLWDCIAGNTNQDFLPRGTIQWSATGASNPLCIDLTDGVTTRGNQLQIWNCVGNANQLWNDVAPSQTAT